MLYLVLAETADAQLRDRLRNRVQQAAEDRMEERIGRELEKAAERMVDHAWESIFGDGIISENGERRTLPFTLNSNVTMEESYHFNIVTSMEIAMTDADGNSEPPLTMKMHFHLFSLLLLTFVLMNTNTVLNKTDENIYQVQPLKTAIEIDGDWDKEVWKKVEAIEIVHRMGADPAFIPKTKAKLLYDEEYIYGIFKVEDRYVQIKVQVIIGAVSTDSCGTGSPGVQHQPTERPRSQGRCR
jgi:hypothetical protein